jgi:ribose 5-phosphate isomerase A
MNPKQRAAEAAMSHLRSGMVVGLGTGSTADYFLQALGGALKSGQLTDIHGVPTSRQSEIRARHFGIPLFTLEEVPQADVTVDGADEIGPGLDLIKGLGGALVREKIVAQNSKKLVIIADASKKVAKLGAKSPLPVEVVPFSHDIHQAFFRSLGGEPVLRLVQGQVFVTDNGNLIYDVRFDGGLPGDARELERRLLARAGVVDCGLFLGMASVALIADGERVETITR